MEYNIINYNDRSEWLERRREGIGGSDAATVLGLNNYATPYTLWLDKTGRTLPDDLSDNEKVYWGNVLEPVVASEFAKRHPEYDVSEANYIMQSKGHPFMLASVDRVLHERNIIGHTGFVDKNEPPVAVLEIKTCGDRRRSDWDDGVPPYYLAQVNHYLAVTGFPRAYVAVLIGGQEYREYIVERDEEDINYLIAKERDFWQMVEDDQMPPFAGSAIDNQALVDQFPDDIGTFIQALDEDVKIDELESIKATIKDLDTKRKAIESELRAAIGDNRGIQTPRYKCTWTRTMADQLDTKRLKDELPDVCQAYTRKVPRDMGLRIYKNKS